MFERRSIAWLQTCSTKDIHPLWDCESRSWQEKQELWYPQMMHNHKRTKWVGVFFPKQPPETLWDPCAGVEDSASQHNDCVRQNNCIKWGFVTFVYKRPVNNPTVVLDLWKSSTSHPAQNKTMSPLHTYFVYFRSYFWFQAPRWLLSVLTTNSTGDFSAAFSMLLQQTTPLPHSFLKPLAK